VPTVKISAEHKQKLERYVASKVLKGERKLSIQETLGKMVDHALRCEKFEEETEELPPLEEDPAWIAIHNPKDWGISDLSENIDKWVYGDNIEEEG